jgi:H+/Cl- antiporter ClcA
MSNVLGLLAFAAYVVVIIGLAAGVTWLVVKWTPPEKPSGPAKS